MRALAFRRCHHCGAIVRPCARCGQETELIEGGYGVVKVGSDPGLKVVCDVCFDGLSDLKERAERGELTPEEERERREWWGPGE